MRKAAMIAALIAIAVAVVPRFVPGQAASQDYADGVVSGDGSIRVPPGYRTEYVLLGAWSLAGDGDTGGEIGLHIVYAPRHAVEAYRRTGRFPDGTVLVKELFNGSTESLTTGEATYGSETAGHFVMVKDDKGRFPDSPLWGDGWGWSFFSSENLTAAATRDYVAECLACHEPARSTDLVYVQGYPVLNQRVRPEPAQN
jgi:hypothetical protein